MVKGILVIGGGISGVQAALDLADAGIRVYLVERTSSIGGHMAQLDKTFPTNDCAMCILSPKLVAAARHPNIELMTNSEVSQVEGDKGDFKVKVIKNPRYVDEDKCVGCGDCAAKCPVKVPNEFDEGLGTRKAIFIPFPQAVPLKYKIDKENCLFFKKGVCKVCSKICKAEAIDYEQEPIEIELYVASIIVATGYDQMHPQLKKEYGYGQYKNVIHTLEFERMLSASGPTGGKVIRPSDNSIPKKIVFIQCVGSRDIHNAQYCSRVCCMYAIKTSVIAKEHEPEIEDISILYMDMRTYGKNFEDYYYRAKDEIGIDFIHGRPAEVVEDPETQDLIVKVGMIREGLTREIRANMVILCSALIPSKGSDELREILGIDQDHMGFLKEKHINGRPCETTRAGIYMCGCCTAPKDIPDSVAEASAAASHAAAEFGVYSERPVIETSESAKSEESAVLEEKPVTPIVDIHEEPRVGVFVCDCGINIAGVVDVPKVVDYAKTLPNVAYAEENVYSCSDDAQGHIQDMITDHKLNRVVVASCTPRTHEPIFRDTCKRAGVNPYLFEMANIRDQCSWVHMHEPELATEKAKDLVRMSVARAKLLQPLEPKEIDVERSALVIGGGMAGMESAIDLAKQGFEVTLVEKMAFLGGRAAQLGEMFPENTPAAEILNEKFRLLEALKVNVIPKATVTKVDGFVGNFEITITKRPRGVDIEKCTECGKCIEVCPVESPYEFDRKITKRKAIYEYPNGWPRCYNIVFDDCNRCGECVKVCETGAVIKEQLENPINEEIKIKVGTITIAIGADMYKPEGEYCFHDDPADLTGEISVISNLGLERLLNPNGPTKGEFIINDRIPKSVAFILCVGSRDRFCKPLTERVGAARESIGDCSRYCCHTTMKQALQLRKQGVNVTVLYVDIRTYSEGGERMYRHACEAGVQFIKYSFDNKPKVTDLNGKADIEVFDQLLGETLKFQVDTVILALGMVARYPDTPELLKLLKVPQCGSGFCMEKHIKLAPIETNTDGIFLAGCLQSPKNIAETLAQGSGSAAKMNIPLSNGKATSEPITSFVDEDTCTGCGTCELVCPYGAIRVDMDTLKAETMEVLCKGCGSCAASCPERAISMNHFRDEQLISQGIAGIGEEESV
jgi:heterodisulfide reductase subunit A-like polyferredoxin